MCAPYVVRFAVRGIFAHAVRQLCQSKPRPYRGPEQLGAPGLNPLDVAEPFTALFQRLDEEEMLIPKDIRKRLRQQMTEIQGNGKFE